MRRADGRRLRAWLRGGGRLRAVAAALLLASADALHADVSRPGAQGHAVTVEAPLRAKIDAALNDAARHTQLDVAQLRVELAEAVTWPDGSLGCPQPGREYAQVLVQGYRIRIGTGAATLEYHASLRGEPFLCPAGRIQPPAADNRLR
jgi:hypothetical protein